MENMINDSFNLYAEGKYIECINILNDFKKKNNQTNVVIDNLIADCLIKSNLTNFLTDHGISMIQSMFGLNNNQGVNAYFNSIKNNNVLNLCFQVTKDIKSLKAGGFNGSPKWLNNKKPKETEKLTFFPMIWPVAFGDTIVCHQFAKFYKKEGYKNVLIMPLNRKDLKELAEISNSFDYVADITLLEDESDRLKSAFLVNDGVLNISKQECLIHDILNEYKNKEIIKMRYFPILDGFDFISGKRIWEEKARLFLEEKKELPKIADQDFLKQQKIIIHLREANYGDSSRNININYSQDLINSIKENFPDHKIVRLGDKSMTPLLNVDIDLSQKEASLSEQIKHIQESELFIGCHSAPQMLAVAVSETPVICINYTAQETTAEMSDNIAKMSYEPTGKQVKAIMYNKMFDENGNELIPTQNNLKMKKCEPVDIDLIIKEIKEVIK